MQGFPINLSRLNAILKVVLMGELGNFPSAIGLNKGGDEESLSAEYPVFKRREARFTFCRRISVPQSVCAQQPSCQNNSFRCVE